MCVCVCICAGGSVPAAGEHAAALQETLQAPDAARPQQGPASRGNRAWSTCPLCTPGCLFPCRSTCLFASLFPCLSICLFAYLSVPLSVCSLTCRSLYLSVYLFMCLSVSLSVYLPLCVLSTSQYTYLSVLDHERVLVFTSLRVLVVCLHESSRRGQPLLPVRSQWDWPLQPNWLGGVVQVRRWCRDGV